jgi:hypothetical protein
MAVGAPIRVGMIVKRVSKVAIGGGLPAIMSSPSPSEMESIEKSVKRRDATAHQK